jgi:tetratricopeptide (TPR) repeat protein
LRLLRLDDAERPDDPFTLFNLGWAPLDLGEAREAVNRLERSLGRAEPASSIVRKQYVLLTAARRHLGRPERALAVCREGRLRCPDDLELPWEKAALLAGLGDLAGAERCLRHLLALRPGRYFASIDPNLQQGRARQFLADVCRRQGKAVADGPAPE